MEVEPMDTVQALKEKIKNISGVPVECQRLTLAGQELKNSRVLAEYKFKREHSSLLPLASAYGAGKVAQMLRENQTIDLQMVPLTLDTGTKERGDLEAFIDENASRISYLRARQQHVLKDRMLFAAKVHAPVLSFMEVDPLKAGVNITTPATSPCKSSAMRCPGSPALSFASLATFAPSDSDNESVSSSNSTLSSPCASAGVAMEIDISKLDVPSNESCSLDAFTQENSERTTRLLKRLHERRELDRFPSPATSVAAVPDRF